MESGPAWGVVVHKDDMNTYLNVVYVMRETYGLPADRGYDLADDVERNGEAVLTWYESVEDAERLVMEIQLRGVRASVRAA